MSLVNIERNTRSQHSCSLLYVGFWAPCSAARLGSIFRKFDAPLVPGVQKRITIAPSSVTTGAPLQALGYGTAYTIVRDAVEEVPAEHPPGPESS